MLGKSSQAVSNSDKSPFHRLQNKRFNRSRHNISKSVRDVILTSWRHSTQKQYDTYLKQWLKFCADRQRTEHRPSVSLGLDFLYSLHQKGLGYSAINTARSALSSFMSINQIDFGSHKLVCQFMKGIFNIKPSLPKHAAIWDPNLVLLYLKRLSPCTRLSLKLLTFKVVTLLALLSVQRRQTLHAITVDSISFTEEYVKIIVESPLKCSRPTWHLAPMLFRRFDTHKRLCVYRYLREYLSRTASLRSNSRKLFISYQKPYHAISKSTLSRWICVVLRRSGVNLDVYSAHSTRAASSSKAFIHLSIDKVLAAGGWSSSSSFLKHYNLECVQTPVQQAMLSSLPQ